MYQTTNRLNYASQSFQLWTVSVRNNLITLSLVESHCTKHKLSSCWIGTLNIIFLLANILANIPRANTYRAKIKPIQMM